MKFATYLLPHEVVIKQPGHKPLRLSVGVTESGRLIALFQSENRANAYVRRLNRIEQEMVGHG